MRLSRGVRPILTAVAMVCCLAVAVPLGAWTTGSPSAAGTVVRTRQGAVHGSRADGYRAFQGVPYAAPPVGSLRWQAPGPARPWRGTRDATRPGDRCAQTADPVTGTPGSTSEDCLYLNVTTPARRSDAQLPVVVWLHGGGLKSGAGSDLEAGRFATRGRAVVVTINYRLGVFGFFGYPGLPGSGTFGLQDQQAALRWVRANIAGFGGDPGEVTLMGESGGGDSVCAQLAAPGARGLFDRAIVQSGTCSAANPVDALAPGAGATVSSWTPVSTVAAAGARAAAALGCGSAGTLACLRAVGADRLLTDSAVNQVYWSPAYRTPTLPERPVDAIRHGHTAPVPLLIGTTRDEGSLFVDLAYDGTGHPVTAASYRQLLRAAFGGDADRVAARYPLDRYRTPSQAWSAIVTDRGYTCPNLGTERDLSARTAVYGYEFADPDPPRTFAITPAFPLGAYHGSDLGYVWDRPGAPTRLDPDQRLLADRLIGYLATFARTGSPNSAGQPGWPTAASGRVLSLAPGPHGIRAGTISTTHHCSLGWDR